MALFRRERRRKTSPTCPAREAITFLVRVKENLEDPQRLLLDI
jgi:hypothetical protein